MLQEGKKWCSRCKETKLLIDFKKCKGSEDGYSMHCKKCLRSKFTRIPVKHKVVTNKEIKDIVKGRVKMESVRRPTKKDILFNLFREVGDSFKLEEVYTLLGYPLEEEEKNMTRFKNQCSYFRKSKHIPEENRIDLRIKWGTVTRVN